MNKKEKFFEKLLSIEPKTIEHLKFAKNKFIIILLRKEKGLIKAISIFLKKLFNIDITITLKTFFRRKMKVYLADADASALFFFGTLYDAELKVIKFLLKNLKENDIFYDVGANYGFYTLLAQELIDIEKGEIHSFEPLPRIFNLLKENAFLEKFKNTFLNNLALSDSCGFADFINRENSRHSGISSLIFQDIKPEEEIIKVQTITLDEYTKNHKPPTVMKIDVEGAEYLVLKGGEKLLKEHDPIIIMEFGLDDLHKNAVNFLRENGYSMYSLDNDGEIKLIHEEGVNKIFEGQLKHNANYVLIK